MTTDATKRPGTVHRQKARQAHTCAECPIPIQPGDSYIYLNTFKDYRWSRYVLCSKCERVRSCHEFALLSMGLDADPDYAYTERELRETVRGFMRHTQNYHYHFMKAWEASTPAEEVRA